MSANITSAYTIYTGTPGAGDWLIDCRLSGLAAGASTFTWKATVAGITVNGAAQVLTKDSSETTMQAVIPIHCAAAEAVVVTVLSSSGSDMAVTASSTLSFTSANAAQVGGTGQTGRDLGASVLISSGTSAGQLSITAGVVAASGNWNTTTPPTAAAIATAVWEDLSTGGTDFATTNSIGKLIVTNLDTNVGSRGTSTYAGGAVASVTAAVTLPSTIPAGWIGTGTGQISITSGVVAASGNWYTGTPPTVQQIVDGVDATVPTAKTNAFGVRIPDHAAGASSGLAIVGSAMGLTAGAIVTASFGTCVPPAPSGMSTLTQSEVTGGAYDVTNASCLIHLASAQKVDVDTIKTRAVTDVGSGNTVYVGTGAWGGGGGSVTWPTIDGLAFEDALSLILARTVGAIAITLGSTTNHCAVYLQDGTTVAFEFDYAPATGARASVDVLPT